MDVQKRLRPPPDADTIARRRARTERLQWARQFTYFGFPEVAKNHIVTIKLGRKMISVAALPPGSLQWLFQEISDTATIRAYFVQAAELVGNSDGAAAVILASDKEITKAAWTYILSASAELKNPPPRMRSAVGDAFLKQQRVLFVTPRVNQIPMQGRTCGGSHRPTTRRSTRAAAVSGSSGRPGRPPRGGLARPCNPLRRSGGAR